MGYYKGYDKPCYKGYLKGIYKGYYADYDQEDALNPKP